MLLKKNIPVSYVFGKIKTELILVSIYSVAVYFAHTFFSVTSVSVPLAIHGILGTILSLLLAFRSNQAYDRWWEARTLWGAIVNDSRSFARQVLTYIDNFYDDIDKHAMKERLVRRQMAWCYSLSQQLRGQDAHQSLKEFISDEECQAVANRTNVPLALLEQHGNDIRLLLRLGWINEYQQVSLDETLSRFSNEMGACERIKGTVFPVTYSVYIHFAVLLFVMLLPFGLIEHFGILQIPLVIAIASSFFLIEKMAIHLQDPFECKPTDTPMTSISRKIEQDLRQMLKDEHPVKTETAVPQNTMFYIL